MTRREAAARLAELERLALDLTAAAAPPGGLPAGVASTSGPRPRPCCPHCGGPTVAPKGGRRCIGCGRACPAKNDPPPRDEP